MEEVEILIYCRVSSEKQKKEGHGLDSQEHRCSEFSRHSGYGDPDRVFRDSFTGEGDFMKRPAMAEMLAYMDSKPHKKFIVIFDDLKRFARDVIFHWKLRKELDVRNAIPKCLNFNFEDSPEGEFIETVLAAHGQLERKQNLRQVIQKQKARLERGYWPFNPPPGYVHVKNAIHGKLLTPKKPTADIIKKALNGFADGRFKSQEDVRKFLQKRKFCNSKLVFLEKVRRLLRRVIYAGYIEYPKWDVSRRKGHHEALISLRTYEKIQHKLNINFRYSNPRKDIREDFPLRGLILCASCRRPHTAAWSKGRSNYFAYYRCKTRGCIDYNKSIKKDFIEGEFEKILIGIKPKKEILALTRAITLDNWKTKMAENNDVRKEYESELLKNKKEIDIFLDRIGKTSNEKIINTYEKKIEALDNEQSLLEEKIAKYKSPKVDFETALNEVFSLLKNPYLKWENGDINDKRLVFKLIFIDRLVYGRKKGFETAKLSLPLKVFELSTASETYDVEVGRLNSRPNAFLK